MPETSQKRTFTIVPENWPWFLGLVIVYYSLIVLAIFLLQDRMLYPATTISPEYARDLSAREGFKPWPNDIPGHKGHLARSTAKTTLGTVIVFHGNAGTALDRAYYAWALNRLGYRVILAEYPGYGARSGSFGERSFVPDAVGVLDTAKSQFGSPIFLFGESLGAGVASGLVAERPGAIDGIALITPWDTLPNLAQRKFWFIPARFIVKSKFDNVANLAAYKGPKAVVLAVEDRIIPRKHALRLYETLGESKRLWQFEGVGHNTWPSSPDEPWWAELIGYLESNKGY
ncbi:MAG: alpha/beta fold hydrolase [Acidobacteriota bacterium]